MLRQPMTIWLSPSERQSLESLRARDRRDPRMRPPSIGDVIRSLIPREPEDAPPSEPPRAA